MPRSRQGVPRSAMPGSSSTGIPTGWRRSAGGSWPGTSTPAANCPGGPIRTRTGSSSPRRCWCRRPSPPSSPTTSGSWRGSPRSRRWPKPNRRRSSNCGRGWATIDGPGSFRRPPAPSSRNTAGPFPMTRSGFVPCRGSDATSPGPSFRSPSIARPRSSRRTPGASWRAGSPGARTSTRPPPRPGSGRPPSGSSPPGGPVCLIRHLSSSVPWSARRASRCAWSARSPLSARHRALGLQDALPVASPKPAPLAVTEACGLVERSGRFLIVQRGPGGLWEGLWEFPTIHRSGADPAGRAFGTSPDLAEGVRLLTGVRVQIGPLAETVRYSVTRHRVALDAYRAIGLTDALTPGPGLAQAAWAPAEVLEEYPFGSAGRRPCPRGWPDARPTAPRIDPTAPIGTNRPARAVARRIPSAALLTAGSYSRMSPLADGQARPDLQTAERAPRGSDASSRKRETCADTLRLDLPFLSAEPYRSRLARPWPIATTTLPAESLDHGPGFFRLIKTKGTGHAIG